MKLLDLEKQKDDSMRISPFLHKEIHVEMFFFPWPLPVVFFGGCNSLHFEGGTICIHSPQFASLPPRLAIGRMVSVV